MSLPQVKDIISIMEKHFPLFLMEEWDNSGLQIGSFDNGVKKVLIALDIDQSVVDKAIETGAELIITHHPMFFKGLKSINYSSSQGRLIKSLITNNITVYSAHTNLDAAENGLNQLLANKLGLDNIAPLYFGKQDKLIKLVVYVPVTHGEEVRKAINGAGSGNIGNYSDCSFRTIGRGTFRPGEGANPFIGTKEQLEEVEEYRLETIVYESLLPQVLKAMQASHPYEEIAYDLYPLNNQGKNYSMGRVGLLTIPLNLRDFAQQVKTNLNIDMLRVVGNLDKHIKKVAVISGSGASIMNMAVRQKVDVLVTGDFKYHEAQEAEQLGLSVVDAGHQETEEIMVTWLANLLEAECRHKNWEVSFLPFCSEPIFSYL